MYFIPGLGLRPESRLGFDIAVSDISTHTGVTVVGSGIEGRIRFGCGLEIGLGSYAYDE